MEKEILDMNIMNRLNYILKIRLFICLTLSISFGFANTEAGSTSNTKFSETDVNDFRKTEKILAKANQTIITMISCLQQVIALLVAAQETKK